MSTGFETIWTFTWIKTHPLRFAGIIVTLLGRILFGIFWLFAGLNKLNKDWLSTDVLKRIYLDRLTEMPPDAFAVFYLQNFAIPLYKLIAWVLPFGGLYVAIALLLGLTTQWAAGVSLFILLNLAIGGYYDASLIPFFLLNILFLRKPTGLWFGLDRRLQKPTN